MGATLCASDFSSKDRARFDALIGRRSDGCWIWMARRNNSGYGIFKLAARPVVASRVAAALAFGEVPAGFDVAHRCDNPPCVNPAHLMLLTHGDNMRDMIAKGRDRFRGNLGVPVVKLTVLDAIAVVEATSRGMSTRAAAVMFGVSATTIQRIVRGRFIIQDGYVRTMQGVK